MWLRQLDMLSPPITLYYKRKNTHTSLISGVITIVDCVFILSFIILYIISYVKRESPKTYYFNRYVDDIGTFSFKDSNFFNYVQIYSGRSRIIKEYDFNKIEIIGINISIEGYEGLPDKAQIPFWVYGRCDNKTDIKGIEHLLNYESFYKSACIKSFYNNKKSKFYDIENENFEWPIINLGVSHPNSSFYGVIVRKCENNSFRLQHFEECESQEEIDLYISSSFISFNTIDHYVDVLNYENPITKYIFTRNDLISSESYNTNNLNFFPGLVKSYDNLFNENSVEKISYFFNHNSQTVSMRENSTCLAAYFIWLQNTQQYYERHYNKLYDLIPLIGGYGSAIIMVSKFIN